MRIGFWDILIGLSFRSITNDNGPNYHRLWVASPRFFLNFSKKIKKEFKRRWIFGERNFVFIFCFSVMNFVFIFDPAKIHLSLVDIRLRFCIRWFSNISSGNVPIIFYFWVPDLKCKKNSSRTIFCFEFIFGKFLIKKVNIVHKF